MQSILSIRAVFGEDIRCLSCDAWFFIALLSLCGAIGRGLLVFIKRIVFGGGLCCIVGLFGCLWFAVTTDFFIECLLIVFMSPLNF